MRVALVVAAMLVLQSVAAAFALGTGPAQTDAFGNPLCINNSVQSDPGKGSDHGKIADCCTLGCPMVGQALGSPPQAVWLAAEMPLDRGVLPLVSPRAGPSSDDHKPGNPRAPPRAV